MARTAKSRAQTQSRLASFAPLPGRTSAPAADCRAPSSRPIQPLSLLRTLQFLLRFFRQHQEVISVLARDTPCRLRSPSQPVPGILPHRLQQPIARRSPAAPHDHTRLLSTRAVSKSSISHSSTSLARTHLLRRFQRPAPRKHRQAAAAASSRSRFEQVVAPVDQRAQGLLAGQRGAASAREQAEAVVQALLRSARPAASAPGPPPARWRGGCRPGAGRRGQTRRHCCR